MPSKSNQIVSCYTVDLHWSSPKSGDLSYELTTICSIFEGWCHRCRSMVFRAFGQEIKNRRRHKLTTLVLNRQKLTCAIKVTMVAPQQGQLYGNRSTLGGQFEGNLHVEAPEVVVPPCVIRVVPFCTHPRRGYDRPPLEVRYQFDCLGVWIRGESRFACLGVCIWGVWGSAFGVRGCIPI